MEPETSASITMGRGDCAAPAMAPMDRVAAGAAAARSVRRRSIDRPELRDGSQRDGRTGATTFILSMIFASCASSSASQSAKSLSRNSSISDAIASRVGDAVVVLSLGVVVIAVGSGRCRARLLGGIRRPRVGGSLSSGRRSPSARPGSVLGSGALLGSPRKSATSTSPRNTWREDRVEGLELLGAVHQRDPGQPVQLGDQRRVGGDRRLRPPGDPLNRNRHPGRAQQVPEMRAQQRPGRRWHRPTDVVPTATQRISRYSTQSPTTHARPAAIATSRSSRYFSTEPRVAAAAVGIEHRKAQHVQRLHPVDHLGRAR